MSHHFFAYISRLRLIRRWGLMRNSQTENDAEHSLQVAFIAHAIALIGLRKYGRNCSPEHILALAAYHDATEVLTGDMPTPVKYQSKELRGEYRKVEDMAAEKLLGMLDDSLRQDFRQYLMPADDYDHAVVKAADRISAYIKCMEEEQQGNREFASAAKNLLESISASPLPEVADFMHDYLPSFALTLDEMNDA